MTEERKSNHQDPDEPPPFLGAWTRVYGAVLLYLVLLIVVFYLFGAAFTP